MAEKLRVRAVAFGFASALSILYLLWSLLLYLMPQAMINILKDIVQGIDLTKIARPSVPIGSVLTGLVEIFILGLIMGWLYAIIYNSLSKSS